MPASPEAHAHIDRLLSHVNQVLDGRIPEDAPADFVQPDEPELDEKGRPWWFGPEYEEDARRAEAFAQDSDEQRG
ncbi:MAG TPA: hypothetical protein VKW77_07625 [Acidimicrobiales bacterium]|nr:hypothetical protein [Acidimicrobiales bacterium]